MVSDIYKDIRTIIINNKTKLGSYFIEIDNIDLSNLDLEIKNDDNKLIDFCNLPFKLEFNINFENNNYNNFKSNLNNNFEINDSILVN